MRSDAHRRSLSWPLLAWAALLVAGAVALAYDAVTIVRRPQPQSPALLVPPSRRLDPIARAFADDVSGRLGTDAVVYAVRDLGRTFEGQIGVRLAYRGTPRDVATDTQWTILETGSPAEIQGAVTALHLQYVLIQSAQPRPRLWQVCAHGPALIRSSLVEVDANSRYVFEVYAVDDCMRAGTH